MASRPNFAAIGAISFVLNTQVNQPPPSLAFFETHARVPGRRSYKRNDAAPYLQAAPHSAREQLVPVTSLGFQTPDANAMPLQAWVPLRVAVC